jgi:hypothetical protein
MAFDLVGSIIDYEDGQMDDEQVIAFFQYLVNSGLAWTLQGSYGRTAMALIQQGLITNGFSKAECEY